MPLIAAGQQAWSAWLSDDDDVDDDYDDDDDDYDDDSDDDDADDDDLPSFCVLQWQSLWYPWEPRANKLDLLDLVQWIKPMRKSNGPKPTKTKALSSFPPFVFHCPVLRSRRTPQ